MMYLIKEKRGWRVDSAPPKTRDEHVVSYHQTWNEAHHHLQDIMAAEKRRQWKRMGWWGLFILIGVIML